MEKHGLMARQSKYNSWVSRDYKTISCKALSCKYNFNENEECCVPSRAKFNNEAKCEGFELKEDKYKGDGD